MHSVESNIHQIGYGIQQVWTIVLQYAATPEAHRKKVTTDSWNNCVSEASSSSVGIKEFIYIIWNMIINILLHFEMSIMDSSLAYCYAMPLIIYSKIVYFVYNGFFMHEITAEARNRNNA